MKAVTSALLPALGLLFAAVTTAAAAAPGPVGAEYLAADRVLDDGDDAFVSCADASGIRHRLVSQSSTVPGVVRTDAAGNFLSRIRLDFLDSPVRLQCTGSGRILVVFRAYETDGLIRVRQYDADGEPIGTFTMAEAGDRAFGLGLHDAFGIYSTFWVLDGDGGRLHGQWLGFDGQPAGPAVPLHEHLVYQSWERGVSIDDAGNALVSWTERTQGVGTNVRARMVDPAGNALGEVIAANESSPLETWYLFSTAESPGLFRIFWRDEEQGGRVGRTISLDPDTVPSPDVPTTTLPQPEDGIVFGPGRRLGTVSIEAIVDRTVLTTDGAGTWLAGWWQAFWDGDAHEYRNYRYVLARSTDLGHVWSVNEDTWLSGYGIAVAAAADGTVMATEGWDAAIGILMSNDSGATFQTPRYLAPPIPPPAADADVWHRVESADIATDGQGTWGVAWLVLEFSEDAESFNRIFTALSYDDGLTWQPVHEIGYGDYDDRGTVKIGTDRRGTWVIAWQTTDDHSIWTARSATAGLTWQQPVRAVHAPGSGQSSFDRTWTGSLGLSHVAGSDWLVSFATTAYDVATYGADGDIFAVRSTDGGTSWSVPAAVNATAAVDGALDEHPSLDGNSSGRAMIAWKSHDPLGGRLGTDADILRAASDDAGATWSWPAPVNPWAESDTGPQAFPMIAAGAGDTWMATWHTYASAWYDSNHGLFAAAAPFDCGDGDADAAEQCDDGNDVDGDGCDSNCSLPACGNAVVDAGEECDDGNDLDDDDCVSGCRLATCGDGFLLPGVESCDTAAPDYSGWCLPTCQEASCGDGFVEYGEEACDDGDTDDTDECTSRCSLPRCGDHRVWVEHEQCDDGNDRSDDSCTPQCRHAACGDGFVHRSVEECDPARPVPFHPCQSDCRFLPMCDQPGTAAGYRASDALTILHVALALEPSCPLLVCDVTSDGTVTVSDALAALSMAVGSLQSTVCTSGVTVAFVLDDPRNFGSLDFDVDFPVELGSFATADGFGDCAVAVAGVISAANAREPGRLRTSSISLSGFSGPGPLFTCTFRYAHRSPPTPLDFTVEVLDAADPNLIAQIPLPTVRVVIP